MTFGQNVGVLRVNVKRTAGVTYCIWLGDKYEPSVCCKAVPIDSCPRPDGTQALRPAFNSRQPFKAFLQLVFH